MANTIDELVRELYTNFRGLLNTNSIVRNSQPNDAIDSGKDVIVF